MPPDIVPPGLTGEVARGPPWTSQDPNLLLPVALSVLVTLAVLFLVYWLYFRGERSVKVETEEEKVLKILEDAGGTIKQPELRRRTGWSEAKVSRVTGKLESEGSIEKLRLGRENVIRETG